MGGDGVVDPFNDPILAGFYWQEYWDEDDLGLTEDDCVPSLAHPIPDAPPLNLVGGGDKLLEFTAPPEGGSYVLAVASVVAVGTGGTGSAGNYGREMWRPPDDAHGRLRQS